jgi:hypothetical protein
MHTQKSRGIKGMSWKREETRKLSEATLFVKSTSQTITRKYMKYADKQPRL